MLYLFDGYNILHAGDFADRRALVDALASFVAVRGARGIVVFDGVGEDGAYGALEVRFASPADPVIERLAAEHRAVDEVWVVSSDAAVRGTAGQETRAPHVERIRARARRRAGRGAAAGHGALQGRGRPRSRGPGTARAFSPEPLNFPGHLATIETST